MRTTGRVIFKKKWCVVICLTHQKHSGLLLLFFFQLGAECILSLIYSVTLKIKIAYTLNHPQKKILGCLTPNQGWPRKILHVVFAQ